jgi:hypothetical protein
MKAGQKKLIFGILLFVSGACVLPLSLLLPLVLNQPSNDQFLVPGSETFAIEGPGRYYLWHDHQTLFHGTTYDHPVELPNGIRISISNSLGDSLDWINAPSISTSQGTRSRQSIAYADVPAAGEWTVQVAGQFEPRVFSFAESNFMKMFGWIFGGIATCVLLASVGVVLMVLGVVRMAQNKKSPSA